MFSIHGGRGDAQLSEESPKRDTTVESHPCAKNAQGWGTRRLIPHHREGPRTLAAASARERPATGDRIAIGCSRQRQRVATRRSRHHLVSKLACHVAIKVSGEGERPALRLSRHKARPVRRETELVDA